MADIDKRYFGNNSHKNTKDFNTEILSEVNEEFSEFSEIEANKVNSETLE